MRYQGKVETGSQAGMHKYEGKAWGGWGRDHEAVYDLDQVRKVPEFEKEAEKFEKKVGAWAFNAGLDPATRMTQRVVDYMSLKYEGTETLAEDLDTKLSQLSSLLPSLGTSHSFIAGAVGTKSEAIKGVLMEGNLRERMVVVENFAKQVLTQDITDKVGLEALLSKADSALNLQKQLLLDADKGSEPWETGDHNRGKTQVAEGDQFRAKGSDLSADLDAHMQSPENQAEATANTTKKTRATTDQTLPEAPDTGGGNAIGKFEAEFQKEQGVKTGEGMKWGNPVADMVMNEANDWVKQQRTIGMPLKGGPSGHTHKFMMVNQILGMPVTADEMRMVCLGHLLPINAHTFVEVLEAAKPFGATPYPESALMYRNLAPYGEGLKGLVGADKFPDEVLSSDEKAAAESIKAPELNQTLVPESLQTKPGGTGSPEAEAATHV
jgi:hypothetical protein